MFHAQKSNQTIPKLEFCGEESSTPGASNPGTPAGSKSKFILFFKFTVFVATTKTMCDCILEIKHTCLCEIYSLLSKYELI